MIVHHTDAERACAHDAPPQSTGTLIEALTEAEQRGWGVADMQRDFQRVFPFDP